MWTTIVGWIWYLTTVCKITHRETPLFSHDCFLHEFVFPRASSEWAWTLIFTFGEGHGRKQVDEMINLWTTPAPLISGIEPRVYLKRKLDILENDGILVIPSLSVSHPRFQEVSDFMLPPYRLLFKASLLDQEAPFRAHRAASGPKIPFLE